VSAPGGGPASPEPVQETTPFAPAPTAPPQGWEAVEAVAPGVTVGRLIGRTFATWRSCLLPFAGLGLIHQAVVLLLAFALGSPYKPGVTSPLASLSPEAKAWAFSGRYWLLAASTMLIGVLVMAAATEGAIQHLAGRRVSIGGMLPAMGRRAATLLGAGTLALLAAYLGLFLLVVPGIMWALAYSLVAPVVMAEPLGVWASLKRSAALAKGSRWKLLGAYLVCGLAGAVPTYLGMGLSMLTPLVGGLVTLAGSMVLGPLLYIAPAVAYHDLRVAKEGATTAELVRVFE